MPPDPHALTSTTTPLRDTLVALMGDGEPVWPRATVVVTEVRIGFDAARRLLPPALGVPASARATVFVADYPATSFGVAYREAGILVHGLLGRSRQRVLHCSWMVVDDDSAMIYGRELFGFPKKMAEIELGADADTGECHAVVTRRGEKLLSLRGSPAGSDTVDHLAGAPAFDAPIVNVRGLPGPAPALLVLSDPPQVVHSARACDLDLEIPGGAHDPLAELDARPTRVRGRVLVTDIGVPPEGSGSLSPRGLIRLARGATRPVGLVSPAWFGERYLFRSR